MIRHTLQILTDPGDPNPRLIRSYQIDGGYLHRGLYAGDFTVPAGWDIYNAPRPLHGHVTWVGNFHHGTFYAAVDPSDCAMPYRRGPRAIESNEKLDGWRIKYVEKNAALAEYAAHLVRTEGYDLDELIAPENRRSLESGWFDECGIIVERDGEHVNPTA